VQAREHITPVPCKAPHNQSVGRERADSPPCPTRLSQFTSDFAQAMLGRQPDTGLGTDAANIKSRPVTASTQARKGPELAAAWFEPNPFSADPPAEGGQLGSHFDAFVLEYLTSRFSSRSKDLPPVEPGALG
jgi:hypothetical protein